jgi:pyruvate dehydrogenase E1 component alpha subunit
MEAIGIVDQAYLDELDQKVRDIVEEAVAFADRSEEPDLSEVYTDVYVD